ncbi:MAG: hypothetical protein QOF76_1057 [Solirubrobacteraceae bacterium]|jgi:uncharacterized protein YbjT (DUF2867 family)|nr:hypothetical protein [Solirubrobacteraceae bacterium]
MARIVIAGGHGQIARLLYPLLLARGDTALGIIRNPEQEAALTALGAQPILCDMERESDLGPFVNGADAVVFAAGAGPGSGPERKQTVDLGAAVNLMNACMAKGVQRYVMISAIGAADPDAGSEEMQPYLWAKAEADQFLESSPLADTIVRPGRLTDDAPTGHVSVGDDVGRDDIARADVAAVVAACLQLDQTIGKSFNVVRGLISIENALKSL